LDSALIERGIASTPKTIQSADTLLVVVKRIPYFMEIIKAKSKFHITFGYH
jgi:hypothetical protein